MVNAKEKTPKNIYCKYETVPLKNIWDENELKKVKT